MKIWITKYALTKGILEKEAEIDFHETMASVPSADIRLGWTDYFHRPNWHKTQEEARARAEVMRQKKIASLERQLAKLRAIRFDVIGKGKV